MGYDDDSGSGGPSGWDIFFRLPWEQLVQAGLQYFGDASEDVGEPSLGIDVVEARVRRLAHDIDAESFRREF